MTSQQLAGLLPLLLLVVLFYFLIIRPQQTNQKKRQQMMTGLHKGDRVVTIGGMYGTVTEVKDDRVKLRIADRVEVEMAKAGVDHVRTEGPKSDRPKEKDEDEAKAEEKKAEAQETGGEKKE
ncbi:MAG TPA: preprotein translocase subunit YajC [Bacillota bacterium]|jgi:preprotein translocase subunit YajC